MGGIFEANLIDIGAEGLASRSVPEDCNLDERTTGPERRRETEGGVLPCADRCNGDGTEQKDRAGAVVLAVGSYCQLNEPVLIGAAGD